MSASSRTAIADGRKKITIAITHSARLAGPMRPAVVSQRNPTIAVMLNSTTSRRVITRGSRVMCSLVAARAARLKPRLGLGR